MEENIKDLSEVDILSYLFNPVILQLTGNIYRDYPWKIELASIIKDKSPEIFYFDGPGIESVLSDKVTPNSIKYFIDKINEVRKVTNQEELQSIAEVIFNRYRKLSTYKLIKKYGDDIDTLILKVKELPDSLSAMYEVSNLGEFDVNEVREEELGDTESVSSSISTINESTTHSGYMPGSVIMIVGKPGGGKSSLMLQEAVHFCKQKKRVLWIALGDLMKYDFITRLSAVVSKVDFFDVSMSPETYFNTEEVQNIAKYFDMITVPAETLTANDILNLVANREENGVTYSLIVIDYDSNIKNVSNNPDNMYKSGGDIYNILVKIARPKNQTNRVVFIASQPKVAYWNELVIPESGAGESSRKQAVVDMMLTLGSANAEMPAGILHIAKNRRGSVGAKIPVIMNNHGVFNEVSKEHLLTLVKDNK